MQGDMMRRLLFPLTLLLAPIVLGAAAHANVWTCSFAGYGEVKGALTLIQDGSDLRLRGAEFMAYHILEDNDVGLVAVRSYAEVGTASKHLGADVMVIDKVTMEFKKGNVFVDATKADNRVRSGTCKRGN